MGCKLQKAPSLPCRGLESCATPAACMKSIAVLRWMIANTTSCQGELYASSRFLALGAQNDDTIYDELNLERLDRIRVCVCQALNTGKPWLMTSLKKETQWTFLNMQAYGQGNTLCDEREDVLFSYLRQSCSPTSNPSLSHI